MASIDLPVCVTCGAQFGAFTPPKTCPICDDPRQYVPAAGQSWTTLRKLRESDSKYKNEIRQHPEDPDLYSIFTVPQFAIGQRAMLMKTKQGKNILWDCITFIDDDTIERVKAMGGISAIVISHPHFYSSHVEWAHIFNCPVYLAAPDKEWVMRPEPTVQHFFDKTLKLADDVEAVQVGGHFPGSLVLAWKGTHLLVADSIAVVLSGLGERERLPGTTSFTFMWSYPNMIPLDPDAVFNIWNAIKDIEFDKVHSGWWGRVVYPDAKRRVLDSAKIFVGAMGYTKHAMLDASL
ncbi:beta-lactamase-like protein [Lipomyces kononenkoae]|uniref:Beta-lactamase-like protein n=1 Tax=Lipomyces kononenkoae TaxID=34357 RepID=A0ACC3T4H1_LIPKO